MIKKKISSVSRTCASGVSYYISSSCFNLNPSLMMPCFILIKNLRWSNNKMTLQVWFIYLSKISVVYEWLKKSILGPTRAVLPMLWWNYPTNNNHLLGTRIINVESERWVQDHFACLHGNFVKIGQLHNFNSHHCVLYCM